ncbi:helix-turn-helix transcriptional regulator [Pinisolibacter sp.]|uniref:helix-turn-helix transcriptional regulator n=1 Tax=Pinisolibacter sp. TaxID=2172024 RepID=UPI002FDD4568
MRNDDPIHRAVAAIYDAATDPDRWPFALQAIADVTGDVGTVLMWRRDDGSFGTIVSPALEKAQADYATHWWQHDIRALRGAELAYAFPDDGVTDRDIVTDEETRTHPIYTDFLIPHGIGWFAAADVAPDPQIYAVISVQRRYDAPRFTDEEVRLVSRLGHHVEQSLRLSIRLIDAEVTRDGLAAALAAMKIGLFGLDSLGRITTTNAAGRALLDNGLSIADHRLAPRDHAAHIEFVETFEAARGDLAAVGPKTMILRTGDETDPLLLHFLPVSGGDAITDTFLMTTRVFVLVSRIGRNDPVDPAILRDLMGLTLAEARVATLVGNGLAPKAAAGRLGITEETARTVLKRVFSKTGVSRQSELVALLAGLVIR